jgi:pilus assembly protein Flp/PilA
MLYISIHQNGGFMNTVFHRQDIERGQGLVEYALILVLVAVAAVAVLAVLGPTVKEPFCKVVVQFDPNISTCDKVNDNVNDNVSNETSPEEPKGVFNYFKVPSIDENGYAKGFLLQSGNHTSTNGFRDCYDGGTWCIDEECYRPAG